MRRLRESDYPAFLRELKEKDIGAYLDVLHEDYEATEASQRKKDMERKKGRKKSRKTRPLVVPMKIDSTATGTDSHSSTSKSPSASSASPAVTVHLKRTCSRCNSTTSARYHASTIVSGALRCGACYSFELRRRRPRPVGLELWRKTRVSVIAASSSCSSAASECTICLSPLNGKRYHNMLDPLSGWVCRACYEYHRKHSKQRSKELIERARAMRDEDGGARACGLRAPMHGKLTHTATTLALNRIFSESPTSEPVEVPSSPASSESAMESFKAPYIDMCEQWTRDQEAAKKRGTRRERARGEEASTDRGEKNQSNSEDDASDTDERRPSKRRVSAL
ncbi:hypothetical protein R3P38DRAFT_3241571 [Favolaschia claudopus]|uniref:GATA-type domain-containing protein n=1 Tax=Favolaschia claudopus TaxID=2862362 RepID=A0AAV9Z617_9AGAR